MIVCRIKVSRDELQSYSDSGLSDFSINVEDFIHRPNPSRKYLDALKLLRNIFVIIRIKKLRIKFSLHYLKY